jgi:hypothetical protein
MGMNDGHFYERKNNPCQCQYWLSDSVRLQFENLNSQLSAVDQSFQFRYF